MLEDEKLHSFLITFANTIEIHDKNALKLYDTYIIRVPVPAAAPNHLLYVFLYQPLLKKGNKNFLCLSVLNESDDLEVSVSVLGKQGNTWGFRSDDNSCKLTMYLMEFTLQYSTRSKTV